MTTMAEQAVRGLEVVAVDGVVRVVDGQDTWLCDESAWNAAVEVLKQRPADENDRNGGEAYGALCRAVRGPIASLIGSCRGEWQLLVARAVAAGVVDDELAAKY